MKLKHDEEQMHRVFGITDQRLKDLSPKIEKIMESTNSPSKFLEKILQSKDFSEEERVFLVYTAHSLNKSEEDNLHESMFKASVGAHSALSLFLGSISAWGLEQALDRAREAIGVNPEFKEEHYEGCLMAIKRVSELERMKQ